MQICVTTMDFLVAGFCTCPDGHNEIQTSRVPIQKLDFETETVTEKHRKRCCPYNFDGKFCRNVGNRILCGYNRNIGNPDVNGEEKNLNNGCRLKNGRLECGYDQPPYVNFRRPPSWDNDEPAVITSDFIMKTTPLKLYFMNTIPPKHTTQCLEIRERIVCKSIL